MITIDPSIVAISIVNVVFDNATHLYRSDISLPDFTPTGVQFTDRRLLAGNYLPLPPDGACLQPDTFGGANHNDTPVRLHVGRTCSPHLRDAIDLA
jgi:hypothetical protein